MKGLVHCLSALVAILSIPTPAIPETTHQRIYDQESAFSSRLGGKATDRVIVRFRDVASDRAVAQSMRRMRAKTLKRFARPRGLWLLGLPSYLPVDAALRALREDESVLYAEPDYVVHTTDIPDDPLFDTQWGLFNTGQAGGTPGADIDAIAAWSLATGFRAVVVGVLDTGVDYTHPDLVANIWSNPADCDSDLVDDDRNGYPDDCHGIDVVNRDSDPLDDNGHGTHVSGTIAAVGNNGLGVAGVAWQASVVACKAFDDKGDGYVSRAIECLEYFSDLKDLGVDIVATNNSYGGFKYSQALRDAIEEHLQRGILFIASAGNESRDIDAYPTFPAGLNLSNVLTVGATTRADGLASFSNVGRHSVHIAAPGEEILSTSPGGAYVELDGTSMAAPHVAGVAALVKAEDPSADWQSIRNAVLSGGDPAVVPRETITGSRLDAYGSLACSSGAVLSRLSPAGRSIAARAGVPLTLKVLHTDCSLPGGPIPVLEEPGGHTISLGDEGADGDQVLGDGVYSALWTPQAVGEYELLFPGNDRLPVRVSEGENPSLFAFTYFLDLSRALLEAAAIGDLNGDGRNDAAVTTSSSGDPATDHMLNVFYQNTNGTLDPPVSYPAGDPRSILQVTGLALGDLNSDGRTDAAVGNWRGDVATGFVGILYQADDGTLEPPIRHVTRNAQRLAIGDLNADGRADLLAGRAAGNTAFLDLFLQDASGDLISPSRIEVDFIDPVGAVDFAVADVSADGRDDIVLLSLGAGLLLTDRRPLAILRQQSSGSFGAPVFYGDHTMRAPPDSVAVEDLDNDGLKDIAVAYGGNRYITDPYVAIFLQDGGGGLFTAARYPAFEIPSSIEIGDIDQDGRNDVVVVQNGWRSVGVYFGAGGGVLYPYRLDHLTWDQSINPQAFAVGDLSSDGFDDAIFADALGVVEVLYSQPTPSPIRMSLWVNKTGAGDGTIISDPPGIDCGQTCMAEFDFGTQVRLQPEPEPGSRFESWLGCVGDPDGACTFKHTRNSSITAIFEGGDPPLRIRARGKGSGIVRSVPPGLWCGGDCSEPFPHGTKVKLIAEPEPLSVFKGWSGPCSGKDPCKVRVNGPMTVEARFGLRVGPLFPPEGTIYYADDSPPQFGWHPGPAQRFKVVWSGGPSFSGTRETSGKDWLAGDAFTPSQKLWGRILHLAKRTGVAYWRVKGKKASGTIQTSVARTIILAAKQTPVLTAPADGQAFTVQDPAPTFVWESNHNKFYRIIFSADPALKAEPMVRSGKEYTLKGNSWLIPDKKWQRIQETLAPAGSGTVHYAIFAEDRLGRKSRSDTYTLRIQ